MTRQHKKEKNIIGFMKPKIYINETNIFVVVHA